MGIQEDLNALKTKMDAEFPFRAGALNGAGSPNVSADPVVNGCPPRNLYWQNDENQSLWYKKSPGADTWIEISPSAGESSSCLETVGTAGEDLGGHRMVISDASGLLLYADSETVSHGENVVGMTSHAAVSGAAVTVLLAGEIEFGTWTWDTLKPLFLGNSGLLSQISPETGFSMIVGHPVTATKIILRIMQPVYR